MSRIVAQDTHNQSILVNKDVSWTDAPSRFEQAYLAARIGLFQAVP